jgi:uncharacterized Zn-finger protein
MSDVNTTDAADAQQRMVGAQDLPLHCPMPDAPLWDMHPRVFLDVAKTGEAKCPYCGTRYVYTGAAPTGH